MKGQRWGAAAAGVFAAACGAFVAASIAFVARHYWRVPAWDHWSWLSYYYEKGLAAALARQYNEHRLVIPGFFYLIDLEVFKGSNAFLQAALLLAQAGCAFLLIRPLWRSAEVPRPLALAASGALAASMFWFLQSDNLFWPFQFHTVFCGFCLLASAWAFAGLLTAGGGRRNRRLAATAALGFLATFSFANGMLIWPVLIVNALWARLERRTVWILGACFLAALAGYLLTYSNPAHHAQPSESLGKPASLLRFMLLFLALPVIGVEKSDVGVVSNLGAYAVAACGLALAAGMIAYHWRTGARLRRPAEAFYVSLLMLMLGTVFLTSLGRVSFPLQYVLASRYATVCLLFWGALAALAAIHTARLETSGGAGRAMLAGLLALGTVCMAPTQLERARLMVERAEAQEQAALGLLAGVFDKRRIEQTLAAPADSHFAAAVEAMRKARRAVFARPEAFRVGARMQEIRSCTGFIDTLEPVAAQGGFPRGARVGGWGWDGESRTLFEQVLVTGEGGEVTGLGTGRQARPDVAEHYREEAMKESGWAGYTRLEGGKLTAFGLTRDGKVCRIGERLVEEAAGR